MSFKINISEKSGKTFHLEAEAKAIIEKELHSKVEGKEISPDLDGYEFEITGASDNAGFTAMKSVEGVGLKKVLLGYGKAMKNKPRKEGKKKSSKNKPKGLRLRKTVRGKIISDAISQINLKVLKQGTKKLEEVFPDQCNAKVQEKSAPLGIPQSTELGGKTPAKEEVKKQEPDTEKPKKEEVKPAEKSAEGKPVEEKAEINKES